MAEVKIFKVGFLNSKILLTFSLIFVFSALNIFLFHPEEVKAQKNPAVKIFLTPAAGSFLVGSTFDAAIAVDTDDVFVNAVEVELKFPADKLQIVNPSSGTSFISLWVAQPTYSNVDGTIGFSGVVPEGINTSSGVVSQITFRVIKAGEAVVKVLTSSSILAADGKGTNLLSRVIDGRYTLMPKPPEGPRVFSETHPDETQWYNNNNPIISWEKESGVTDFSFSLDQYPQAVPDNESKGSETTKAFENLVDGLWYFHIKAKKEGIWGAPSHFLLRIDTTPPAAFEPKVEFLTAAIINRTIVSFFTTDALSDIDHYGVVVIDKREPPVGAPVFVEAQSPYQVPVLGFISGNFRIIVRAVDKAGNVRDATIDANFPESITKTIKNNLVIILSAVLIAALTLIFIYLMLHFLFRRRHKIPHPS